ncbi:MAG: LacI family DNA-binding transcriptional regulator [Spirochaetia bacterium]|jgi:LacI family transcriptional regulator
MKTSRKSRIPTQKEVAESLGISRGTVDRALHGRKGISEATRRSIAERAKMLGYRPNRFASFLSTGKTLDIAMITPADPLWKSVKEGARAFAALMGDHVVNISWHETGVHDLTRETEILTDLLESEVDGIGIAPADPNRLKDLIDRAIDRRIAVVTLNTDAPESRRICFVGQNPLLAGRIAGELMGKFLMGSGKIIAVTAFRTVLVHKQRLDAFVGVIDEQYPGIDIAGVYENHDSDEEACRQIREHLSRTRDVNGIYLTSGIGPAGVVRALDEAGLAGKVRIVCFDYFPETVRLIKSGFVHAAIGEDPFMQGYQTVKILCEHLIEGKEPLDRIVHTKTDIGLRENIDLLVGEEASHGVEKHEPRQCP